MDSKTDTEIRDGVRQFDKPLLDFNERSSRYQVKLNLLFVMISLLGAAPPAARRAALGLLARPALARPALGGTPALRGPPLGGTPLGGTPGTPPLRGHIV